MNTPDATDSTVLHDLTILRLEAETAMRAGNWHSRSCWNCNDAHEHMRHYTDVVLNCFACGHGYFKGVDITIPGDPATDGSL